MQLAVNRPRPIALVCLRNQLPGEKLAHLSHDVCLPPVLQIVNCMWCDILN